MYTQWFEFGCHYVLSLLTISQESLSFKSKFGRLLCWHFSRKKHSNTCACFASLFFHFSLCCGLNHFFLHAHRLAHPSTVSVTRISLKTNRFPEIFQFPKRIGSKIIIARLRRHSGIAFSETCSDRLLESVVSTEGEVDWKGFSVLVKGDPTKLTWLATWYEEMSHPNSSYQSIRPTAMKANVTYLPCVFKAWQMRDHSCKL